MNTPIKRGRKASPKKKKVVHRIDIDDVEIDLKEMLVKRLQERSEALAAAEKQAPMNVLQEAIARKVDRGISYEDAVKGAQRLLNIRQSGEYDEMTDSAFNAVSNKADFLNDYNNFVK